MSIGFLILGPLSGSLSDRFGARPFTVGGLVLAAASFAALALLPMDFPYWLFTLVIGVNGLGSGIFSSPNTTGIMNSVPAGQRGAASGMRGTFHNSGSVLSIGIFFSLMIVGLSSTLSGVLRTGLNAQQVPAGVADQVAGLSPVGSLFAAFLGFNPVQTLLASPSRHLVVPGQAVDPGPTGAIEALRIRLRAPGRRRRPGAECPPGRATRRPVRR